MILRFQLLSRGINGGNMGLAGLLKSRLDPFIPLIFETKLKKNS